MFGLTKKKEKKICDKLNREKKFKNLKLVLNHNLKVGFSSMRKF